MATNRIYYFDVGNIPREDIYLALEDYIAGIGVVNHFDEWRWCVRLPGTPSHPLTRQPDARGRGVVQCTERWFEVWVYNNGEENVLDVITRRADPVTNAIADGFANFCKEWWLLRPEFE